MIPLFIGTVNFFDLLFIAFRMFLLHIYSTGPGFQLNTSFEMLVLLLVLNPWKFFAKFLQKIWEDISDYWIYFDL